jgi:hypothetical protein
MRNVPPNRFLALLLLFVLPAGLISGLNTGKTEELRTAVDADVSSGEILAAHGLDLAAHRSG